MYFQPHLIFGLAALFLVKIVSSESSFSEPPANGPDGNFRDNSQYKVGDHMDVQWTSNLTTMDLRLFQEYPRLPGGSWLYDDLLSGARSTSMIWTVTLGGWLTNVAKGEEAVFFWVVAEAGNSVWDAHSHYFNVSISSTKTSSIAGTSTLSPKHTSSQTTISSHTTSGAAETEPESNLDKGLSDGTVAGIAVGSTIGGLLAICGLGVLAWKHFRKPRSVSEYPQSQQAATDAVLKYELPDQNIVQHQVPTVAGNIAGLHEAP